MVKHSGKRARWSARSIALFVVLAVTFSLAIVIPIIILSRVESVAALKKSDLSRMYDYFGVDKGLNITWAHAVNNRALLDESLKDPKIMMLEADVISNPLDGTPIMAHPPAMSSDTTLETFLNDTFGTPRKGVKLDFKEVNVIISSLKILRASLAKLSHAGRPIMLNADVLVGPNNPVWPPLDATVFFNLCKSVQGAILSPGWTTAWSNTLANEGYTWKMVKEMADITSKLDQSVTFPVRASLATLSKDQLKWLLHQDTNRYSLTVWTSKADTFDCKGLDYLKDYPLSVMFDLPSDLCDNLRLQ